MLSGRRFPGDGTRSVLRRGSPRSLVCDSTLPSIKVSWYNWTVTQIFISYSRPNQEAARTLARTLEQRGWSVWWDRQLVPGEHFDEVIAEQLEAAACVIVLWSVDSTSSRWVRDEANSALSRRVLVPARLDDTELPLGFRTLQTADLRKWRGGSSDEEFVKLEAALSRLTAGPAAEERLLVSARGGGFEVASDQHPRRLSVKVVSLVLLGVASTAGLSAFVSRNPEGREPVPIDSARVGEIGETTEVPQSLLHDMALRDEAVESPMSGPRQSEEIEPLSEKRSVESSVAIGYSRPSIATGIEVFRLRQGEFVSVVGKLTGLPWYRVRHGSADAYILERNLSKGPPGRNP